MFADNPGGGKQAELIAKLEGEKEQYQAQLTTIDERTRQLDGQEQALDKEATELEEQIRALATEESQLLQRKKELKENAKQIGNRRTELMGGRKKLQREQGTVQSSIAKLDTQLQKIHQQLALEEAQKSASIQVDQKPAEQTPSEDQRSHQRVAVEVEVSMHTQHNFYTGLTENLSEGGLFVATYESLSIGTQVALTIRLPEHEPFKAEGQVRWIREHSEFTEDVSPGVGVQFTELQPDHQTAIEKFIQTRAPLFYETA